MWNRAPHPTINREKRDKTLPAAQPMCSNNAFAIQTTTMFFTPTPTHIPSQYQQWPNGTVRRTNNSFRGSDFSPTTTGPQIGVFTIETPPPHTRNEIPGAFQYHHASGTPWTSENAVTQVQAQAQVQNNASVSGDAAASISRTRGTVRRRIESEFGRPPLDPLIQGVDYCHDIVPTRSFKRRRVNANIAMDIDFDFHTDTDIDADGDVNMGDPMDCDDPMDTSSNHDEDAMIVDLGADDIHVGDLASAFALMNLVDMDDDGDAIMAMDGDHIFFAFEDDDVGLLSSSFEMMNLHDNDDNDIGVLCSSFANMKL
jgi:hypothetical protein